MPSDELRRFGPPTRRSSTTNTWDRDRGGPVCSRLSGVTELHAARLDYRFRDPSFSTGFFDCPDEKPENRVCPREVTLIR
jgi:hypothetical protein